MLLRAGHPWARGEHRHGADCGHGSEQRPAVQRSTVPDVLRGAGRPLDSALRADLEPRMGADFSGVRVHDDAAAQASAAEVGAAAYTAGNHIVIGKGGADRRTMAHELTHVIQQSRGPVAGTDDGSGLRISDPSDRFEREAEANAARIVSGPAPVQRQADDTAHDAAHGAAPLRTALRTAPGASGVMVQRTMEEDLTDDPQAFLAAHLLSVDVVTGMRERRSRPALEDAYAGLGRILGGLPRHWFVLTPDGRRETAARRAFLLTPALEMYVADEEYRRQHSFLEELVDHPDLPPAQPEGNYLRSSYVPYLTGGAKRPETEVGHQEIPREPGEARGANLVFTATMNGCAFAVTGSSEGPDMFRAWHYQSPGSRMADSLDFQHTRGTTDWFGDSEYMGPELDKTLPEVTNILYSGPRGWEVHSQEVLTSTADTNDAALHKTTARPLNLNPADRGGKFGQARAVFADVGSKRMRDVNRAGEGLRTHQAPQGVRDAATAVQMAVAAGTAHILVAGDGPALREGIAGAKVAPADLAQLTAARDEHADSEEVWPGKLRYFVETIDNYHQWLAELKAAAQVL
ncbi:DUF4157 domain-containing protein [Streptomyces sp. NBC_00102]|uniref:eCIS core domain-containing protein n=1 Tax=Streptomyces sp. NBC_00102 TaxID=2975652 RepID=UPI00224D21A2|nr:DUF4157 domain-containing protein [Streptomyces sp. NBC_00102]MCX5396784.1 DUF4157 domain-containing protein [Streptomyces sp. NBC_00102]